MTDQQKVIAYLRVIAHTQSLAEAQREARLALRVLGEEVNQ